MTVFEGNRQRLDAFRRGDRQALAEIFSWYARDVATLLRNGFHVGEVGVSIPGACDRERERDLLQEVFARAFAKRARLAFNGLSPYRMYLMRIAKNLLVDEVRRRDRHAPMKPVEVAALLDAEEVTNPPSPENELQFQHLRAATQRYRASLTSELSQFVQLRFEEGLSQQDLADRLGLSRRQIRGLEHTVVEGLRRFLRDQGLLGRDESSCP